jgi:hypothetical protein
LIDDHEKELSSVIKSSTPTIESAQRKKAIMTLIECHDANKNSALSEAATGGSGEVVRFLIKSNANVNSRGHFGRTPLWRAAFASNTECVQILLENGADPRIAANDGQRAVEVTTNESIQTILKEWNIKLTERMLQQIESKRLESNQEQMKGLELRKLEAQRDYKKVNTQFEACKTSLYKCKCELQRLHDEYLINKEMYGDLIDVKEKEKDDLIIKYEQLREECVKSRIFYKDILQELNKEKKQLKKQNDENNEKEDASDDDNEDEESDSEIQNIQKIHVRELDDLILRDLNNIVSNSLSKWPLIMDTNEQAATYLRYRDTNYINCLDMSMMQGDKFRLALLGSIRYGKPFVLDLMQYDDELLEATKSVCAQIDKQLFEDICSKNLIKNSLYLRLIKKTDGEEYSEHNFSEMRLKNFKVLFLTSNPYPNDNLLKLTMPLKIVTKDPTNDLDF